MPLLSAVDCPACLTAAPNPSTASTCALAMISRNVSRGFPLGVADDHEAVQAEPGPVGPARPGGDLPQLSRAARGRRRTHLPLEKYQSDRRPPFWRAALELPPWKISGCGRPGHDSGLGFRLKSRIR